MHLTPAGKPVKPHTPAAFRKKAEAGFLRANPDARAVGVAFDWKWTSPLCDCKGGPGKFRTGMFHATSPGYGTQVVNANALYPASRSAGGYTLMIRPTGVVR
jgi:hypothetical protein